MFAELFEFKRALELKLRPNSEINLEFDGRSTEGQGKSFRTQGPVSFPFPMQEETPPPRKSVSPLNKPVPETMLPICTFMYSL